MMDINNIINFFKKFLLMIFTNFGVSEEFEALGIDITKFLTPDDTTEAAE